MTRDRTKLPELHFAEAFYRSPHEQLAPILASDAPAARVVEMGSLMLVRHADVHDALVDRRLGAMGTRYYEQQGWTEGPYIDWVRHMMLFLDPPDHDRLRALVNRAFTPRQIATVRPITRRLAGKLADEIGSDAIVDLYDAFAQRLPLQVICEMLAVPEIDHQQLGEWTAALSVVTAFPSMEARAAADAAMLGFEDYVERLIRERRAAPGDDLLSALIAAEEAGDRLSSIELVAMVVQLFYGGHETTRNLIGSGLFSLLGQPDQLDHLRRNHDAIPNAVEEMLRFEPSILYTTRVALENLQIAGIEIEEDEMILLGLCAANRDPRRFDSPQTFDVTRTDIRHVTFGFGAHFCVGASIARMEGQVAFETLVERFALIEFAGPTLPRWAGSTALRSLESFPVHFVAA
jgi:cytochrome P450